MTITVTGPDGAKNNFPDGTPDAVIERAMRQQYGGPDTPPSTQPRQAPQQPRRKSAQEVVGGALANLNNVMGGGDEITAATQTVTSLPWLLQHSTPQTFWHDVAATFHERAQESRGLRNSFLEDHPNVGNLLQGTGNAVAIAPTLGTGATAEAPGLLGRVAAGRGLPALGAKVAQAGTTGATYGTVAGALGADDGDRIEGARSGALLGGLLGSAAPVAVDAVGGLTNAAKPFASAFYNSIDRLPPIAARAQSGTGAFGAQLLNGGSGNRPPLRAVPPPPSEPPIPGAAMNTIERLADRSRQTPDQLEQNLAAARANPQGRVMADMFGDPGTRTMRSIVQGVGQTGERAAPVVRQRFQDAPGRIFSAIQRGLNVGESRFAAVNRLKGAQRALSESGYRPLWDRQITPEQEALYEQRVAPLLDPNNPNPELRSVMQRAIRNARRQFNLDVANGEVHDSFEHNLGLRLHYIKMELGELARFEANPLRGTSGNRLRSLRTIYRNFGDALDPGTGDANAIIPGYRNVTAQYGDSFTGLEALDRGADWLNMGADEVRADRASMTPFELQHARIALADAVRHGTAGRAVGNENVANRLDKREVQDAIAAAFDTPEQAAAFLDTVNTQNELMRNAAAWGGGSQTYSNLAHGEDQGLNMLVESGGHAAAGNHGSAAASIARFAQKNLTGGIIERANNQTGEVLLRPVEGQGADTFARQVIDELNRRRASRGLRAVASRGTAAGVGSTRSRRRN